MIPRSEYKAKRRIIAIGDIHGDYRAIIYCLKAAKVINNDNKWIGSDTYVVQCGDCLDRYRAPENENNVSPTVTNERSEKKILVFLWDLDEQAKKKGGRVITIIGNHEIFNTRGSFGYVSNEGMKNFNGKRKDLWKPGGVYAKKYSAYPVILKIGSCVFMHGGLRKQLAEKYSLKTINTLVHQYLNGQINEDDKRLQYIFNKPNGVIWFKGYSKNSTVNCDELKETLKIIKAKHMIVAHVPQMVSGITSNCDGGIWRTDLGMSEAFGKRFNPKHFGRIPAVLEILNDKEFNILVSKNEIHNWQNKLLNKNIPALIENGSTKRLSSSLQTLSKLIQLNRK